MFLIRKIATMKACVFRIDCIISEYTKSVTELRLSFAGIVRHPPMLVQSCFARKGATYRTLCQRTAKPNTFSIFLRVPARCFLITSAHYDLLLQGKDWRTRAVLEAWHCSIRKLVRGFVQLVFRYSWWLSLLASLAR